MREHGVSWDHLETPPARGRGRGRGRGGGRPRTVKDQEDQVPRRSKRGPGRPPKRRRGRGREEPVASLKRALRRSLRSCKEI